jgi:hypothetical protein
MKELPPWFVECYAPAEFSGLKSFPFDHTSDLEGDEDILFFYEYGDSIVKCVSAFIALCKKNDLFHEDVMMNFFLCILHDSAKMWYDILSEGKFSYFSEFLEPFSVRWDYNLSS